MESKNVIEKAQEDLLNLMEEVIERYKHEREDLKKANQNNSDWHVDDYDYNELSKITDLGYAIGRLEQARKGIPAP